jgi:hypothetical protein
MSSFASPTNQDGSRFPNRSMLSDRPRLAAALHTRQDFPIPAIVLEKVELGLATSVHLGAVSSSRGTPILDERKSLPKATEGCPVLSSSLHRIFKMAALIVSVV